VIWGIGHARAKFEPARGGTENGKIFWQAKYLPETGQGPCDGGTESPGHASKVSGSKNGENSRMFTLTETRHHGDRPLATYPRTGDEGRSRSSCRVVFSVAEPGIKTLSQERVAYMLMSSMSQKDPSILEKYRNREDRSGERVK